MLSQKEEHGLIFHWKSLVACSIVAMCPFQYGLDSTLIGGLQAMPVFLEVFGHKDSSTTIGYNISTQRQQLITSLMTLGAFMAAAGGGYIATFVGRKAAIWIACILCLVADIIMMTTTNIGGLYFGRFIIGIANGLFDTFAQLYILECAPAKYRGMMIGVVTYWITFGALIGTIVDNFSVRLGGKISYTVPLGVILIMPAIIAIGLLFIPESPGWLLQMKNEDKARKALQRLRACIVDEELASMKAMIKMETSIVQTTNIMDLWRNPIDRRRSLLAIGAVTLQVASGASFIIPYSTYFFEMANIGSPFENTCIMAGVGSFVLIVNSLIITKYGRRRVFLGWGLVFCGLTQLIMAVVYTAFPGTMLAGKVTVGCSILNLVFYNGMIATYALLEGGELPSQRLRSYTLGIATSVGFAMEWLVAFTAPYFINPDSLGWGPKYGYVWAVSSSLGAIWVWFFLPEVKGRTFEEIDALFEAHVPARKFRKNLCVTSPTLAVRENNSRLEQLTKHKEDVPSDAKAYCIATQDVA